MDVSIIIVNWNSKEFLRDCIRSVERHTAGIAYEIVVVDSASFDGCGEMIRAEFPQVRFIQSETNIGFARANNLAYRSSRGGHILFLNPDTELTSAAVNTLLDHLSQYPDSGAVGCKLLNRDGSVQTSCVRAFPTVLNQFLESEVLRRWFPRSPLWGMAPLFKKSENPAEVDAISGACLMIRRSVFETIGMFSTDYFMYSEDIDICYKAREAGWTTYYVPTAVVVHYGGESSSKNPVNVFPSVMMLESRSRFFLKTRPLWYCWLYRLAMLVASIARIVVVIVLWPFGILWGRGSSMARVLTKWTARLRWTLGGENWVRTYPTSPKRCRSKQ